MTFFHFWQVDIAISLSRGAAHSRCIEEMINHSHTVQLAGKFHKDIDTVLKGESEKSVEWLVLGKHVVELSAGAVQTLSSSPTVYINVDGLEEE